MLISCIAFLLLVFSMGVGPQSNTRGVSESIATSCLDCTGELHDIAFEMGTNNALENPVALNYAFSTLAPIVDGAIVVQSFDSQHMVFDQTLKHLSQYVFQQGYAAGDHHFESDGMWFSMFGQHANQKIRDDIIGYSSDTKGVVVGYDWSLTDDFLLGIAGSWANLDVDHKITGSSKTDANSYSAIIYAHYDFSTALFANMNFSLGYNYYHTKREIIFGDLRFFPEGKYHALQPSAQLELGYDHLKGKWHIIPLAQFFYSHLNMRSYTETRAGNISQTVEHEGFDTLVGGLGLRLAYDYFCNHRLFQPEVHAHAYYDFLNDRMQTTSTFIGTFAIPFNTSGPRPPRDSYNLGASISTPMAADHFFLSLNYDFDIKKDYHDHAGYLRIRYEW